ITVADDPGLAGTGPHRARLRGRNGERADCCCRLFVENRHPAVAAVGGLPDPARGRARVINARIARDAGDGRDAVADLRSDEAELEVAFLLRVACRGRGGCRGDESSHCDETVNRSSCVHRLSLTCRCREPLSTIAPLRGYLRRAARLRCEQTGRGPIYYSTRS